MAGPYKNMQKPMGGNANAYPAKQRVPAVPGKRDPQVNEKRGNLTPDGEKSIPWPAAPGTDHNPIK